MLSPSVSFVWFGVVASIAIRPLLAVSLAGGFRSRRRTHERQSSRHGEDNLPARVAGLDEPVSGGRIGERKRLHHLYPQ
jgi:hypothetical protein